MTTSSPRCQFTGVATLWVAVSCRESITRRTSSKFRPVVMGYPLREKRTFSTLLAKAETEHRDASELFVRLGGNRTLGVS